MFTVFDHDRIMDDDIAGEAYYDLQFVPGLTHDTVQGGFATVPQIEMPLVMPFMESRAVQSKYFCFVFVVCVYVSFLSKLC